MILNPELEHFGILEATYPLPPEVIAALRDENWKFIDDYFLQAERPEGALFEFLAKYLSFSSIEHIIAIRSAPFDEDGIWHDDGSRILGFTLSLTADSKKISGGHLRFKQKSSTSFQAISTRPLGQMLLFKTGVYGFEHMVTAVTAGKRIVLAGWCS